ncbi:MAG: cytochrome c [Bacteroidia bacterium]
MESKQENSVMTFVIKKRILPISIMIALFSAFFISATPPQQAVGWVAPKLADTIKNPLKGNVASIAEGKKIYIRYCVVCHGAEGRGNGIASAALNPRPVDHTSETFQKQTDGAIFWEITTGKYAMASYAKILTKTQRWQVINFIRTLKKTTK